MAKTKREFTWWKAVSTWPYCIRCLVSEALVREIGAAPDDVIVGFSGRWSEEKNPLGFVEIARLVDLTLPIRFVMTGTGHQRPAIELAIHEAHFPDGRFHLLGEVPEITPVLASFDLLVIPSVLTDGPSWRSRRWLWACRCWPPASARFRTLFKDWRTGWLCEPNDAQRVSPIGSRMQRRDLPGLKDMRRQARAYAEGRLDRQGMLGGIQHRLGIVAPGGSARCLRSRL